jgi:WXG100 family type VII secretion target
MRSARSQKRSTRLRWKPGRELITEIDLKNYIIKLRRIITMALIRVTANSLRSAAEELKGRNGEFKTQVESLVETEERLKSSWQGQANDAFHAAFTNDRQYMDSFYALIEKYCAALETIAEEYDRAESTNTETATSRNI